MDTNIKIAVAVCKSIFFASWFCIPAYISFCCKVRSACQIQLKLTQGGLLPLALEMKLMEKSDGVTQIDTIFLNVKRLTLLLGDFSLLAENWNCYKSDWCVSAY